MRRGNQRAVKQVSLQADFVLVAVLFQRLYDGLPVLFFRTFGHDAFAFALEVEDAAFGKGLVAIGIRVLLAVGVVRVPIISNPFARDELHDVAKFSGGADVLRAFVFEQQVYLFFLSHFGHFAQRIGNLLVHGFGVFHARARERAQFVRAHDLGAADGFLQVFGAAIPARLFRSDPLLARVWRLVSLARRLAARPRELQQS